MHQALRCTRPGGHMGFVGVNHDVQLSGDELFFSGVHLHGGWIVVTSLPTSSTTPAYSWPMGRGPFSGSTPR